MPASSLPKTVGHGLGVKTSQESFPEYNLHVAMWFWRVRQFIALVEDAACQLASEPENGSGRSSVGAQS